MLFNSLSFALFFPVVVIVYFWAPHRVRWAWLLAASCYFYMAFIPVYILVLLFTIAIDYVAGILIENAAGRKRKTFLILSLAANIGVLAVFKYFNFFNETLTATFSRLGRSYPIPNLSLILPIGLSFHTFQSMAYTIEIYRGRQKAERHLGIFALYVMFFPQLVAGPIERPQNLLHQFREKHVFNYDQAAAGLRMMAWGLFMKSLIADNLAPAVNAVYSHPKDFHGLPLITATICFAFQIYCDFAGYSYIAIGAARIMGFKLMDNFRQPYFSKSIPEFWRRWHISLSSWFKDYLYIPLGGSRVSLTRRCLNLLVVFLISGLWHGANWTYVIWGGIHGLLMIVAVLLSPLWTKVTNGARESGWSPALDFLQIGLTFALVTFAWIFFRATAFSDAWYIATHLFQRGDGTFSAYGLRNLIPAFVGLGAFAGVEFALEKGRPQAFFSRQPLLLRWAAYYSFVLFLTLYGRFGRDQFIYFQF